MPQAFPTRSVDKDHFETKHGILDKYVNSFEQQPDWQEGEIEVKLKNLSWTVFMAVEYI